VATGNELSRTFVVDPLPEIGLTFEMTATADERAALARRFDLINLDALSARGTVQPGDVPGWVVLEGRIEAEVVQSCVVTTEPVPAAVSSEFRRIFAPPVEEGAELELDPLADEPEPLPGSRLDIGEIVAEELSLALDPYPRIPGAEPTDIAGQDEASGPFAALERLRRS
jgi:uncharacterized metal-binding protein YceD (DUF177 family)